MRVWRKDDFTLNPAGGCLADHCGDHSLFDGVVFRRAGDAAPVSRASLAHRMDVVAISRTDFRHGGVLAVGRDEYRGEARAAYP